MGLEIGQTIQSEALITATLLPLMLWLRFFSSGELQRSDSDLLGNSSGSRRRCADRQRVEQWSDDCEHYPGWLLPPGQEPTCTATFSDGTDSVSKQFPITLENRSPEQPSVSLSPESVTAETESLSCSATGTDPDGQSVSFSIHDG